MAITKFATRDREPRVCTFFATVPGSAAAGAFDFAEFAAKGLPFLLEVGNLVKIMRT